MSPGCIPRRDLMQEKHDKILLKVNHFSEWLESDGERMKRGCEAGGDSPAVFDTRASARSVPRASFSNHRFNG